MLIYNPEINSPPHSDSHCRLVALRAHTQTCQMLMHQRLELQPRSIQPFLSQQILASKRALTRHRYILTQHGGQGGWADSCRIKPSRQQKQKQSNCGVSSAHHIPSIFIGHGLGTGRPTVASSHSVEQRRAAVHTPMLYSHTQTRAQTHPEALHQNILGLVKCCCQQRKGHGQQARCPAAPREQNRRNQILRLQTEEPNKCENCIRVFIDLILMCF